MKEEQIIAFLSDPSSFDKGFKAMVYAYQEKLYWHIRKLASEHEDANDILQNTFIKAYKGLKKFEGNSSLYTWLYRIARNTAIDKIRSANLKVDKEVQINETNVYKLPASSLNQDAIDLKKHVGTLDQKYQMVLRALFFEGMTQQEASEELDIPLGTVKSRLKIGLRELKKIYDPQNV